MLKILKKCSSSNNDIKIWRMRIYLIKFEWITIKDKKYLTDNDNIIHQG